MALKGNTMSNKFTRITIDVMHNEADNIEVLDYILQLVETVQEEGEYLELFTVVSGSASKVELKEVGPAYPMLKPVPTSAPITPADKAEIDEPTDEFIKDNLSDVID